MAHFPIEPLDRFHGASASIKRPREVTHFSYDDSRTYRADDSGINYYAPPQIGSDLKAGFDTFHQYEEISDPHLDSLLRALAARERTQGTTEDADIVTWRGMMTKIMTAPCDNFAEFAMRATRLGSTIYLEEDFAQRAVQRAAEASRPAPPGRNAHGPSHQMMTYWGYKFETLCLLPQPPDAVSPEALAARTTARVSNYAQHCSVVRTSFGPHSLLLGGEVDGLRARKPPDDASAPTPWIELKTAEELPPRPAHRDILRFERKLLKFWAQSFLLGVPTVIVGWRSKQGILTGVQELETSRIPGMVRRGTKCWDGNVCINFATEFLGWLKGVVADEGVVYEVKLRKKGGSVEVVRVAAGGGNDIVSQEFREWREELQRKKEG